MHRTPALPRPSLLLRCLAAALVLAVAGASRLRAQELRAPPEDGAAPICSEPAFPAPPASLASIPQAVPQTAPELPAGRAAASEPPVPIPLDDGRWSRRNIFKRIGSDQKYLVTTWWPEDFRNPAFSAPLLVATVGAFASSTGNGEDRFDQDYSRRTQHNTQGRSIAVAKDFSALGDGAPGLVGIGATWLVARWTGNARLADTMSLTTEALVDSGIWVTGLKLAFARTRPSDGGQGKFLEYNAPGGQSSSSFPSGHAMGAFSVATVVSSMYPEKKWVPWVFYGTAGAVAVSRVALGRHYPTDVIVGGLLGNSIGRMVVARERESDDRRPGSLSNFSPIVDPATGRYGVAWSYAWPEVRRSSGAGSSLPGSAPDPR